MASICVSAQRLEQAGLGRRQQLRQDRKVAAAGGANLERCVHIEPGHMSARRQPQLTLGGEQDITGLVLLYGDQRVLAVRAEPSLGSGLATGAAQAVVVAGPAVVGPSAGLEVPAAEGPQPFCAALRSTWRSVSIGISLFERGCPRLCHAG